MTQRDLSLHSASLRALSHDKSQSVVISNGNRYSYRNQHDTLHITTHGQHPTPYIRGSIDSTAYNVRYHDNLLHKSLVGLFKQSGYPDYYLKVAESLRIDALASKDLPGVKKNISLKLLREIEELPPIDASTPLDEHGFKLLLIDTLFDINISNHYPTSLRPYKKRLASQLRTSLAYLDDQSQFAQHILAMLTTLKTDDSTSQNETSHSSDNQEHSPSKNEPHQEEPTSHSGQTLTDHLSRSFDEDVSSSFATTTLNNADQQEHLETIQAPGSPLVNDPGTPIRRDAFRYKIYSTAHDEVISATHLCNHEELKDLRELLDQRLATLAPIPKRITNRFVRQLLGQLASHWQYGQEEGYIDTKQLAHLVSKPNLTHFYKRHSPSKHHNTVVSLLLDNSGSMRGRPITLAAMSAELIAKLLEQCSIKVEILGFTTANWKGGLSRKSWEHQGQPANPGRLNDIRHIVYKAADTPWRKARLHMGAKVARR